MDTPAERRGISLLMSNGYLSCVCRDIQRHIAQCLDLEQFTVSSVVLDPPPDGNQVMKFFAIPSGCVTIAFNGDIWHYDTHGIRQRVDNQITSLQYNYGMFQSELILVPYNKQFVYKYGWLTTKPDGGVFMENGEKLFERGCVNSLGDVLRFDDETITFPNGVRIKSPPFCHVQLARECVYLLDGQCGVVLYSLTGLRLLRVQLPFHSRSFICDYRDWRFGRLEKSTMRYEIYDFSIFGDASGPPLPAK